MAAVATVAKIMAKDIHQYLQSMNSGWVNYRDSVDSWKIGSPEALVRGIAVAWMSYTWAVEKAAGLGCNLFITHEPTYYHHRDDDPKILDWPEVKAKKARLSELGITILRCHDLWDQVPEIGIPDAWGKKLGLGAPIEGKGYYRVYDGGGRTAADLARQFLPRVQSLGQKGIELIGPKDRPVRRIVIGTGAITPYRQMLNEYRADLVICSDDGFCYWRDAAHAIDNGHSVMVFHHHVTEDHGMELLADHLGKKFPGVPVHFIGQSCMYELVT